MSKMQQQYEDNLECWGAYNLWKNTVDIGGPVGFRYMDKCQALIYENDLHIWLKSYDTVVAIIDKSKMDTGYDILRLVYGFTATSQQHIRKFFDKYGITNRPRWVKIPDTFCPD